MGIFTQLSSLPKKHYIDTNQSPHSTILISGMGRSGTTWLSDIINHDNHYRQIFEPFVPELTDEAKIFSVLEYIREDDKDPQKRQSAINILSGKIKNTWIDNENKKFLSRQRIIKEIRTNLMLGWLHKLCPGMAMILLIRHPYAVANSYVKLGWNLHSQKVSALDLLLSQKQLLDDFPIIKNSLQHIDLKDTFERTILTWCIHTYVPLTQLQNSNVLMMFYEHLLFDKEVMISSIFRYLNLDHNIKDIEKSIHKPSSTNFNRVTFTDNNNKIIREWDNNIDVKKMIKTTEILSMFKLDHLYDQGIQPLQERPSLRQIK